MININDVDTIKAAAYILLAGVLAAFLVYAYDSTLAPRVSSIFQKKAA